MWRTLLPFRRFSGRTTRIRSCHAIPRVRPSSLGQRDLAEGHGMARPRLANTMGDLLSWKRTSAASHHLRRGTTFCHGLGQPHSSSIGELTNTTWPRTSTRPPAPEQLKFTAFALRPVV